MQAELVRSACPASQAGLPQPSLQRGPKSGTLGADPAPNPEACGCSRLQHLPEEHTCLEGFTVAGGSRRDWVSQGGTWSLMPTLHQQVCDSQSGATQDAFSSSMLSWCGHTARAAIAPSLVKLQPPRPLC